VSNSLLKDEFCIPLVLSRSRRGRSD